MKTHFKKIISVFLVVIMLITAIPFTASAATSGTCGNNLTWTFDESTGELSVTGTGAMYDYGFSNRPWESYEDDIKSVVIGNSVTTIGEYAFGDCYSLTSVTIGDSVTTIGERAFRYCYSLTSVTIGDSVTTIGEEAFCYCDSLTSVTIGDSVTTIGYRTFYDCNSLTSVTIPDSVTTIGEGAFCVCDSLASVTIGDSVTTIGYVAFFDCDSLTSVEIPDSVTTIEDMAFYYCDSLTDVYYSGTQSQWNKISIGSRNEDLTSANIHFILEPEEPTSGVCGDNLTWSFNESTGKLTITGTGTMYNNYEADDRPWESYKDDIKSVTIDNGVTTIGNYAFAFYTNLTSVTIPDSVTTIGEGAFACCDTLTSVTIGNGVTTIGVLAFACCNSLTSVTIPDSVTIIGSSAFLDCDSLTGVTIGTGVTTIGEGAFCRCTGLTSVTIPDSVTTIGDFAFRYCDSLTDVYYSGTQEQWNKISIGSYNENLTSANIHFENSYNSTITQENLDYYIKVDDEHKKMQLTATLNENWFATDSEVYNHDLGGFCSQFTVLGYTTPSHLVEDDEPKPEGYITKNQVLRNALMKMGFSDPEVNLLTDREEVNYFIAHKNITVNGAQKTLVFAGFIGSYHEQWYSNFDPGTGETHKGFEGAKNFVKEKLTTYMDKLNLDRNSTEILLTGHSRGAATANLLAADFIKYEAYAPKENVYTYTFATPNPTTLDETEEERFERIFNIVNPEDFVTKCMPAAWGYSRYGTTYVLPSKTNTAALKYISLYKNMQSYYSKITNGREYKPYAYGEADTYFVYSSLTAVVKNAWMYENIPLFAGAVPMTAKYFFLNTLCHFVSKTATALDFAEAGAIIYATLQSPSSSVVYRNVLLYFLANGTALNPRFEDAHMADTYCAYMMTLPEKELTDDKEAYRNTVNCPVDIEVIDNETGEVVGRIVNNVIDEEIATKENSVVMTVDGDSKSFWLPSDGDYEVRLTGNDNGTMDYTVSEIDSDIGEINRVNFYDVEIEDGKTLTGEIIADEFVLEEYALETENGETLESDEILSDDELQSVEINVQADGNGSVTNSMNVTKGDYVTISAEAEEGNVFLGWYENNVCVSEDETYSFVAKEEHSFIAKFKETKIHSVNVDGIEMNYKDSTVITPYVSVDDGVDYIITYSSSDPDVAYVDENGEVYASGEGSADITVTVTDEYGNVVTDTCEVNVSYAWWQWIIIIVLFGWIWY